MGQLGAPLEASANPIPLSLSLQLTTAAQPIEVTTDGFKEVKCQENCQYITTTTADTAEIPDDDVQFIFCAPRRMKKQKRLGLLHRPSAVSQFGTKDQDQRSALSISTGGSRGSTGMTDGTESRHIVNGQQTSSASTSLLPITPLAIDSDPSVFLPSLAMPSGPNGIQLQTNMFPSLTTSTASLSDPISTFSFKTMPHHNSWVATANLGSNKIRKIKTNTGAVRPCPVPYLPPPQISAQENCVSSLPRPKISFNSTAIGVQNLHKETKIRPSIQESTSIPITMAPWMDFSWDACNIFPTNKFKAQHSSPAPGSTKMATENQPSLTHQVHQQCYVHNRNYEMDHRQTQVSDPTLRAPHRNLPPQAPGFLHFPFPGLHQVHSGSIDPSRISSDHRGTTHGTLVNMQNMNQFAGLLTPTHECQRQNRPISPLLSKSPRDSYSRTSDLQRNPSLYAIPPWPSIPSTLSSPQRELATTQPHGSNFNCGISNVDCHRQSNTTACVTATSRSSNLMEIQKATRSGTRDVPATDGITVPAIEHSTLSLSLNQPSSRGHFNPSTIPWRSSKHPPNLIVDIAQTCQEHFPFAVVAKRHGQPIQKVFDTFSAIVHLPLLRSARDGFGQSPIAVERMRYYKNSKKSIAKAQEAERMESTRGTKARADSDEGDRKRARTSSKAPRLLKAAILNNARDFQTGTSSK